MLWCRDRFTTQGPALANNSTKNRADSEFKKVQRDEDRRRAMHEYEQEAAAVRVKTAKLRALRLARDAAAAAEAANAAPKPAKKRKKAPSPAGG